MAGLLPGSLTHSLARSLRAAAAHSNETQRNTTPGRTPLPPLGPQSQVTKLFLQYCSCTAVPRQGRQGPPAQPAPPAPTKPFRAKPSPASRSDQTRPDQTRPQRYPGQATPKLNQPDQPASQPTTLLIPAPSSPRLTTITATNHSNHSFVHSSREQRQPRYHLLRLLPLLLSSQQARRPDCSSTLPYHTDPCSLSGLPPTIIKDQTLSSLSSLHLLQHPHPLSQFSCQALPPLHSVAQDHQRRTLSTMASTLSSSSRGYRPLGSQTSGGRMPPPMPAALTKIALATRKNQILAMQALQPTAINSSSSSSSSSSSPGSPPPVSAPFADSFGQSSSIKRGRKFQACRAPSASGVKTAATASSAQSPSSSRASKSAPLVTTTTPHWAPEGMYPLIDPASGRRSEIYSLTNDRYPGAPGTALAKAREAQQKALQTAKREAAKKLASKAELEHLGVKGLGKKRKSSSPYATIANGGAHTSAQAAAAAAAAAEKTSIAMSRETSRSRTAAANASNAKAANSAPDATSNSGSRTRRAPSRSNSPVPITSSQPMARRSSARGTSAPPTEEEAPAGRGPSRGSSPPDGSLKGPHGNLASTAPFQSSPLAAGSVTLEPITEAEPAEPEKDASKPQIVVSSDESPSAGRGSSLKRKASNLSHEIGADHDASEGQDADKRAEDQGEPQAAASKKAKIEEDAKVTEGATEDEPKRAGSPSSTSSSRRTSPRMKARGLASDDQSKAAQDALDKFEADADSSNATKSRLSALSLEHADASEGGDGLRRTSRARRGGAKSDVDGDEVRDADLGGPGGSKA